MASGKTTKTLVWGLMGLLILGLGGFGVTNLGGTVRSVGSVGDKDIDINLYARALQEEIRALEAQRGKAMTFEEARRIGLDRAVLGRIVTTRALDHETSRIGLSIGDENLRNQILEIPAFQGLDGSFDREAYKFALSRSGLNEAAFEDQLREDTSRTLLQRAIINGTEMPPTYADTLIGFIGERRAFTWARYGQNMLEAPLPEPSDVELNAYHQAHIDEFTLPEMKRITYAWLRPEALLDQVEIDEAALREQYEARKAEFDQPERRLVERLGFSEMATAEAARSAIDAEESTFEDQVTERGLVLADVDLGDVTQEELGAAGAAAFAADEGSVVGPFETNIGPALFRINTILPAQVVPFEEAVPTLRDEVAFDRARRLIETRVDDMEDRLAGGATLENLAEETDMELATIDWYAEAGGDIAAYTDFREAAEALNAEDFPTVMGLDDGGIFAMRLDEVLEPRVEPLEDVRDRVLAGWEAAETLKRLRAQAEALLPQLEETPDMAALGLTAKIETDILRSDFIPETPPDFLSQVFELTPGDTAVIDGFNEVLIVRLDKVLFPDMENPEIAALRVSLMERGNGELSQDLFSVYATQIQSDLEITLDEGAINAVHTNFR